MLRVFRCKLLFLLFLYSGNVLSVMLLNADNVDTISHFRAFKPIVNDDQTSPLVRHIIEDSYGYIWMAGDPTLVRYNGYEFKSYLREGFGRVGSCGIPYIHLGQNDVLWAGDCGLHKFDPVSDKFTPFVIGKEHELINYIEDYKENKLLIAGDDFGLLIFDTQNNTVIENSKLNQVMGHNLDMLSLIYDDKKDIIWLLSKQGIFTYQADTKQLDKIYDLTPYAYGKFDLRDMSLDQKNGFLWVATANGLIRVDVNSQAIKMYDGDTSTLKGLTTHHTTTTYLDSNNNLWVGTEKSGVCLYKPKKDTFICINASVNKKNSVPVTTIEDIHEDSEGSLWISANQYGSRRITPDLEKIITLKDTFSHPVIDYFPHTFDAVVRDNYDVWLGTDGGGINIFNHKDKTLRTIKHDPENDNSLPSNSIISLNQGENGYIWAGFWAGGISRINPDKMQFENFNTNCVDPKNCLVGNNVFMVKEDGRQGLWISIWGYGLQYYNIKDDKFSPLIKDEQSNKRSENQNVVDVLLDKNRAWIVGSSGLEYYDYEKNIYIPELTGEDYSLTSILMDGDIFYLGSRIGLYTYNIKTKEIKRYTKKDGLSDNAVFYLKKDKNKNIWVATANGISIINKSNNDITFTSLLTKDGLVSNQMSTYGEFFEIDDHIYSTSKAGINIIDPNNLPRALRPPKTVISSVQTITNEDDRLLVNGNQLINIEHPNIEYKFNSLQFEFTALSYVFPEKNKFKFRLVGWKETFTEVDSYKRVARFTNLKPGEYVFEVYASNSSHVWDTKGARYSFTILTPWFKKWWAILLFLFFIFGLVYLIVKMKIEKEKNLSDKVEKELSQKVDEKTSQLLNQAIELKRTSESLSLLNLELESRVDKRTSELQVEINERKIAESKLFHMAFHDSLTGLPNREWLIQKIEKNVSYSFKNNNYKYCLMFLDGDRFKQINDTHGHTVGDQLLISSAKRLSSILEGNQFVTRLGGDEFTVFSEGIESEDKMIALAKNIIEVFSEPFCIENNNIHFNVSIGIVICDHSYQLATHILRDADIAMYKAKEQGKGTYKLFDTEMRTITLTLAELESDLHNAVENNEFFLMYQPIINLKTNFIIGFEALVRWEHPVNGMIPPLDFIPLAEETGLIWDIGAWVIDEALRKMREWHTMFNSIKPTIAVNISSGQLRNAIFLDMIDDKIKKHNVNSSYLKLELTESVLMENNETVSAIIDELNHRNIDLAIDDFGTGYSSLAYLNEIPVQQIKIDKRFIDAIDATASGEINEDALAIVQATISLAKSLRKEVTAEGIESKRQLDALREFGCDYAQGYFIGKPLSVDDVKEILLVNSTYDSSIKNRKLDRDSLLDKYKSALKKRGERLRDKH